MPGAAAAADPGPRGSGSRHRVRLPAGLPRGNRQGRESPRALGSTEPTADPDRGLVGTLLPEGGREPHGDTWPPDGAVRPETQGPGPVETSPVPKPPQKGHRAGAFEVWTKGFAADCPERRVGTKPEHTLQLVPDDRGCPRCQRAGQAACGSPVGRVQGVTVGLWGPRGQAGWGGRMLLSHRAVGSPASAARPLVHRCTGGPVRGPRAGWGPPVHRQRWPHRDAARCLVVAGYARPFP